MGSSLYTTINHRSGKGVENKAYVKQKIEKSTQKAPKSEAEMKIGRPSWWSNKNSPRWSVDRHHCHAGCVSGLIKLPTDKKNGRSYKINGILRIVKETIQKRTEQ